MTDLVFRLLERRGSARAPIRIFRVRLGALFGGRMILLEHRGRTTGARRYAVLEVIDRPSPTRYLVVSGFGDRAQWYRNVQADPAVRVTLSSHRPVAATARVVDDVDARATLRQYVIRHRRAWETFRPVLERAFGAPVDPATGSIPPMVALDLESAPVTLGTRLADVAAGHPRGPLGRVGGQVMAIGNAQQEAFAVQRAGVAAGDQVLVVGAGPGVGVQQAARRAGVGGHVVAVDPSPVMLGAARRRVRQFIERGTVEVRQGTAERTGCADASADVAISVNNVMLWNRSEGLDELARVLRPGGRLVISCHRRFLPTSPEQLVGEVSAHGFDAVDLIVRPRSRSAADVELCATRVSSPNG